MGPQLCVYGRGDGTRHYSFEILQGERNNEIISALRVTVAVMGSSPARSSSAGMLTMHTAKSNDCTAGALQTAFHHRLTSYSDVVRKHLVTNKSVFNIIMLLQSGFWPLGKHKPNVHCPIARGRTIWAFGC